MKTFQVSLEPNPTDEELGISESSTLEVVVRSGGKQVPNEKVLVELSLTRDAMLSLGIQLIRHAKRDPRGAPNCFEIRHHLPDRPFILGVRLAPTSAELIVDRIGD